MKVIAGSEKERFYIENILKLLFDDAVSENLTAVGEQSQNIDAVYYSVRLTCGNIASTGCSAADTKTHFGLQKALLAAIGNAVFEAAKAFDTKSTPYGILTGVRPVKVALYYLEAGLSYNETIKLLCKEYRIRPDKAKLITELAQTEVTAAGRIANDDFMLYVSIPFCPSRCKYCSFISQAAPKETNLIPLYTEYLRKELGIISEMCKSKGKKLRAVYFGGGTPTTLSAVELDKIISDIFKLFPADRLTEFTVECGRPDTVDAEKLGVLHDAGVGRISINPQTTNDEVLRINHRNHTARQFFDAFALARKIGFPIINTDLIAGLDGDSDTSFYKSVDDILSLSPENITVHSLYRKRASDSTMAGEILKTASEKADKMADYSYSSCINSGYQPYYLYRQKGTVGNLENLGYSVKGAFCLYNIAMMEDIATVISCGAGGVTKIYKPQSPKKIVNTDPNYQPVKRFSFYKYPTEYIKYFESIDKMYSKIYEAL